MSSNQNFFCSFDVWYSNTNASRNVKLYDGPDSDYIFYTLKRTPQAEKTPTPVYHTRSAHTSNTTYISKRTVHLWLFLHQLGVKPPL